MGKKSPTWTEESVTAWLKENLVHINLVEYAGHSERPSIFVNTVTGDEFETKFRILLTTVRKGAPKDWQPQAINWNQRLIARWLERHSETTRLIEYAGNAKGLSTFKSAETGEEYQSAWYSLMKSVKEKGPQYNYLESTVTEEAARKWCEENLKHWELLEYGGTTNSDSKWLCTLNGEEYTRPLSNMKAAHKLYGYEYEPRCVRHTEEYARKWCEDNTDYIRLVKYAGYTSANTSVWLCTKQQVCFWKAFADVRRAIDRNDRSYVFDVSPSWDKHTDDSLGLKVESMFADIELVKYGGTLAADSTFLDKTTGRTFQRSMINMYRSHREFGAEYNTAKNHIEEPIKQFLLEAGVDFAHDRVAAGRRYDFLVPSHNLIIECDGLYWHSDAIVDKKYHQEKRQAYLDAGYKPLFFRGDEIREQFAIVSSILNHHIGKSVRLQARKTTVRELAHSEAKDFFTVNHLMGPGSGKAYGLVLNEEIVAAIQTRCTNKTDNLFDISRYCNKLNHTVVGGYSKLLRHIERTLHPTTIQTFVDLRYGTGDWLLNEGYTVETEYLSFYWTDTSKRYHRLKYPGKSGEEHGLHRIWDCGQRKYVKHYG